MGVYGLLWASMVYGLWVKQAVLQRNCCTALPSSMTRYNVLKLKCHFRVPITHAITKCPRRPFNARSRHDSWLGWGRAWSVLIFCLLVGKSCQLRASYDCLASITSPSICLRSASCFAAPHCATIVIMVTTVRPRLSQYCDALEILLHLFLQHFLAAWYWFSVQ